MPRLGKDHTQLIFWGVIGVVTGGATAYPVPGSGTWAEGTEIQIPIPRAGTVANLYVYAAVAPGGAVTDSITVRRSGVNTAITCNLVGAAQAANDTTNTQAFAVGERIGVQYVAGAGSIAERIMIVVEIVFPE